MGADQLDHYKRLERDRRRPLGRAPHPDRCPKLRIRGVEWALPPRQVRIAPRFGPDGVELVASQQRPSAELAGLRTALAALRSRRRCPACGQTTGATVELDLRRHARVLEMAFAAAARALRCQYDLGDEELSDLLAIDGDAAPVWVAQVVRYACGLAPGAASPAENHPTPRPGLLRRLLRMRPWLRD